MRAQPYLNFPGTAEAAFRFYAECFETEITELHRFGDTPMEGFEYSAEDAQKIMHVSLRVGDGYDLMASDSLPALGHKLVEGNNFYVSLNPDTQEEGQRIFDALSAGGKIEAPYAEAPWGAYWGAFRDRFGVQWMVNWDKPGT